MLSYRLDESRPSLECCLWLAVVTHVLAISAGVIMGGKDGPFFANLPRVRDENWILLFKSNNEWIIFYYD